MCVDRRPVRALLVDGTIIRVRALDEADGELVAAFYRQLPVRDRYLRFFSAGVLPTAEDILGSRGPTDVSLGAFRGETLIGVAQCFGTRSEPATAEVALAVAHGEQEHGVGTLLLEHLASRARRSGVRRFVADVLPENERVRQVLTDVGLPVWRSVDGGEVRIELDLALADGYPDALATREQRADIHSLLAVLAPRSVMVVGAGRGSDSVGHAVLSNVIRAGFPGRLVAVNPHAAQVCGVVCHRSVDELTEPVDLAVLCVPPAANVSMNDTWNLGWKLAAVLRGTARPELLHTYSEERQKVAQQLIDFDREFATMFSAHPAEDGDASGGGVDPEAFQQYFITQGRFTAGVATKYAPSMITAEPLFEHLAEGFPVGMRFHSAPVVRPADAKRVHLGHVARADGAWRLYVFADRNNSHATELCEFLGSDASPITRFTPAGADPDSVIDVRAVFQQGHRDLAVDAMPSVLLPRKGTFGLVDYEKMFCPDPQAGDIFDLRGVNRETGCIVVVRPDQYVAHVLPLDEHEALTDFFAGVLVDAK